MSYLNQVTLIGNVGNDPEVLKSTESACFVRLSIATKKRYLNNKNELVENVMWHTVYVSNGFGKYIAAHCKKGAKVLVQGELRTRPWQDKAGQTHYQTAVYATECRLLLQKKAAAMEPALAEAQDSVDAEVEKFRQEYFGTEPAQPMSH